jgi:hypothetical protein
VNHRLRMLAIPLVQTTLLVFVAGGLPARAGEARLNGLLVDAARVPESVSYYRHLIDFCKEWGLNALVFRVADDQGLAVRFPSHSELITHRNALTPAQARDLAEYAHQRGIELIPEIESFGHTGYITRVPRYAALLDRDPKSEAFSGLIPVDPRSKRLIADLYRDAASMFPSRYLHGGCDEVNWGGSEQSRQALKTKGRAELWAEYLNALDETARSLGKEFVIWGDHVLRKEPGILDRLNKDIIVWDWDYWTNDPAEIEKTARKALAGGFRVIGGPALSWCRWGPRAGTEQLRNIDAYADAYRRIDDPRCLGVIVTNWLPSRYIQGSIWDGLAYAAVAAQLGSAVARESAFRLFVQRHYGGRWSDVWADVFRTAYDIVANRKSCAPSWMGPPLPVPWSNAEELAAVLRAGLRDAPPFTRLLSQLGLVEPSVRRNPADFRAFRLSLEYLQQLYWRNTSVVEQAQQPADHEAAAALIRAIAERDRRLVAALDADWDSGRPPDSPIKAQLLYDSETEDQLLFRFGQAARFSAQLAEQPERFWSALNAARAAEIR